MNRIMDITLKVCLNSLLTASLPDESNIIIIIIWFIGIIQPHPPYWMSRCLKHQTSNIKHH